MMHHDTAAIGPAVTGRRGPPPAIRADEENDAYWARADQRFFDAWRQAARLAGARYFGTGERHAVETAESTRDLIPCADAIWRDFARLGAVEQAFLVALSSFHDPREAARLRASAGRETGAAQLDPMRRALLSELLLNSTG